MKSNEQVKIRPNPETAPEANDLLAAAAERARLAVAIERLEADIGKLRLALSDAEKERDALLSSTSWRLTSPLRTFVNMVRRLCSKNAKKEPAKSTPSLPPDSAALSSIDAASGRALIDPDYDQWVATCDSLTDADRMAIRAAPASFNSHPVFSLIVPLTSIDEHDFWLAVASVESQLYGVWELLVVPGNTCASDTVARLRRATAQNGRIRWIGDLATNDIGRLINAGLAQAAGDFVSILPVQGVLPEHALFEVAALLQKNPSLDFIFSDEDWIDDHGRRLLPHFKPDWNIDLALGHDMVGHLALYRHETLTELGGARTGLSSGHAYDMSLRVGGGTLPDRIAHIPRVLFHRFYGSSGPAEFSSWEMSQVLATDRAIARDFLVRQGLTDVTASPTAVSPLLTRIQWPVPQPAPLVSLIVPTHDQPALLARCVAGLLYRTDYPAMELIVVDHDSREPETHAFFKTLTERDTRVRVLPASGPFNYSAINNQAVREARGDIIVHVNNDVDVIDGGWLQEMVSHASRHDVGAVGAKLLYENGQVQHAGVVLGVGSHAGGPGVAGHFGHGARRNDPGYFGQYAITREVSAVTAACIAFRRTVYDAAGGLDEVNLPISFNDVDLCLRIRALGLRIVWTPFAELYHLESMSRGPDREPEQIARAAREADYMRAKWGTVLDHDPFYNANFDRQDHTFRLRARPRAEQTWWKAQSPGFAREIEPVPDIAASNLR
jgi:GT2 family glycosyltransferase